MSTTVVEIHRHHRFVQVRQPTAQQQRQRVDMAVRSYAELLSMTVEQTGLAIAVALRRLQISSDEVRAIAAGKERVDRIFRARADTFQTCGRSPKDAA
jgi:hypothetical protein